jgi:uncharacterized protein YacL
LASGAPGFLDPSVAGRLLLAAWIASWVVVGYSIMPYITVESAGRLVRGVMDLSTSEFVAAVVGLLLGLLMGVLLGLPLANLPGPYGWLLPIVSVVLGFGMMGLTVAKRGDLRQGLRDLGLVGRPAQAGGSAEASDGPHVYVDTSAIIDGR